MVILYTYLIYGSAIPLTKYHTPRAYLILRWVFGHWWSLMFLKLGYLKYFNMEFKFKVGQKFKRCEPFFKPHQCIDFKIIKVSEYGITIDKSYMLDNFFDGYEIDKNNASYHIRTNHWELIKSPRNIGVLKIL